MIDARDQGRLGTHYHGCNDFTNVTFFFKDDKMIVVYRYGWTAFGQNVNKPVMKAGKEETTCLMGVAGSVKASVHVIVKAKKGESPAPEPAIKGK